MWVKEVPVTNNSSSPFSDIFCLSSLLVSIKVLCGSVKIGSTAPNRPILSNFPKRSECIEAEYLVQERK